MLKRTRTYDSYSSQGSSFSYPSYRRGTRKYKPRAAKVRSTAKLTDIVKALCKREIDKTTELKTATVTSAVLDLPNYANSNTDNNVIPLVPDSSALTISQGTAASQRIGNTIRVRKVYLHLSLFPSPYNATENSVPIPQDVICYIFSLRANESSQLAAVRTFCGSSFFDAGGSVQGFSGDLSDFMKRPNTDAVIVHKRFLLKLGAANYETNTGTQANNFSYANNDYKLNCIRRMDITKFIPKNIKFEDTATTIQNNPVYLVMSPCPCDGGAAADTTSAIPCTYSYGLTYEFTDK